MKELCSIKKVNGSENFYLMYDTQMYDNCSQSKVECRKIEFIE